jgi:hypothetical protein
MSDVLSRDALQPADVLLYRGEGLLPKLIRFFDGTQVNHAGLYLGNAQVGEAIAEGVVARSLDASIAGHTLVIVRRLTATVATMQPVVDRGRAYVAQGQRYAYEQLLLLAFLALARKLKVTPILDRLLRRLLDGAAAVVAKLTSGGRQPMICSEFVYRSYDEALPGPVDVYSLSVGEMALVPPPEAGAAAFALGLSVASPAARGRGVHPHSLLAVEMARRRGAGPQVEAAPAPAPEPVTQAELDGLITRYLEEVKATLPAATPEAAAVSGELDAAVEAFARTYFAATAGPAAEAVALSTAGPMEHLFRTAADFVTPGDLLNTQSLVTVGEVK